MQHSTYRTFKDFYIIKENGDWAIVHRSCNKVYPKPIYTGPWWDHHSQRWYCGYCRCGEEFPEEVVKNVRTLLIMDRI